MHRAVQQALTDKLLSDVCCTHVFVSTLQGPPGTGKTSTIIQFVSLLLQHIGHTGKPILACAQSNVAVDNLYEGLCSKGVSSV